MAQRIKVIQTDDPVVGDLDVYRQLVELQKQMIQLSQQNERAKQACATLRAQVTAKATARPGARSPFRSKVSSAFKMLPVVSGLKSNLASLVSKETSSC